MRAILVNMIMICVVPIILAYPHIGILSYYWFSYMNPHRLIWGGGLDLPWGKLIAVCTLLFWLISKEPKKIPMNGITVLLIMFLAWVGFTTLFALFPVRASEELPDFAKIVLMALIATALLNTRQRLHAFIWVVVISLGFYTVKGGLFTIVSGGGSLVLGPPRSQFADNNSMSRIVVMSLPLLYFLYLHSARKWVRQLLLACCLLSILGLIGTNSRGGFVAFIGMMGYAWLFSRRKLMFACIGFVALVAGIFSLSAERLETWTGRISTIEQYEEDASAQGRFEAWAYAMRVAASRPITGGGLGTFSGHKREAHSNYFEVLGDHGYVGLLIYLLLALVTFRSGTAIMRKTRSRPDLYWARDLALLLKMSMVGYLVGGLVINHTYFEFYYTLIALMVVTRVLVERALAENPTPAAADRPMLHGPGEAAVHGPYGPGGASGADGLPGPLVGAGSRSPPRNY